MFLIIFMERVVLLNDGMDNSWKFAEKIADYFKKEREISVSIGLVEINHFRNNEIDLHIPETVRQKDVYFIHNPSKNPQEWWVELLLIKDLLLSGSSKSVSFVLPNMLYSRQDRKNKPHVPISARSLARSISPGLKRIITMDLHAPQIQGFYPEEMPLDNLYSFPSLISFLNNPEKNISLENLVVVSPDAGGAHRAEALAGKLNHPFPIAVIHKVRGETREIYRMDLSGDVKDRDVLIVDDMIDSGGTSLKSAELLRKKGAKKIYLYGTHGLFTCGTEKLCSYFNKVITTNTHYQGQKGIEVIDVSPVFAEAIYRAQKGLSVSKLFE